MRDYSRKRYCSKACVRRVGVHQIKRTYSKACEHCGTSFMGVGHSRFCSKLCRNRAAYRRDPSRQQAATKRWEKKNKEEVFAYRVEWRRQNRAAIRRALWEAQGGKCYLCGDELDLAATRPPHIEHDHSCCPKGIGCPKCRRGLSCATCNRLLGMVHDDPDRLRRIADNLECAKFLVAESLKIKPVQAELFAVA